MKSDSMNYSASAGGTNETVIDPSPTAMPRVFDMPQPNVNPTANTLEAKFEHDTVSGRQANRAAAEIFLRKARPVLTKTLRNRARPAFSKRCSRRPPSSGIGLSPDSLRAEPSRHSTLKMSDSLKSHDRGF